MNTINLSVKYKNQTKCLENIDKNKKIENLYITCMDLFELAKDPENFEWQYSLSIGNKFLNFSHRLSDYTNSSEIIEISDVESIYEEMCILLYFNGSKYILSGISRNISVSDFLDILHSKLSIQEGKTSFVNSHKLYTNFFIKMLRRYLLSDYFEDNATMILKRN